jgi:hypothetical protein
MASVLDASAFRRSFETIGRFILNMVDEGDDDHSRQVIACSLLEALARTDPSLVAGSLLEEFTTAESFTARSCAANLM